MPDEQPIASVTIGATSLDDAEGMRWLPEPGQELSALMGHKLDGKAVAQASVTAAACSILGRGVPPGEVGADTGLVVGYVQSGKTLSFTAVMALARDNGFQLVIVIAGSSAQLADQSEKRIRKDLQIGTGSRRTWAPYPNPKSSDATGIEGLLDVWRDESVPRDQCRTVLITVMKQHTHLRKLAQSLGQLNLAGISALIIDDEADQASLNTQAQKNANLQRARESTTYRRLMELRRALPSHTYLQYTATPQAPLLISIIDSLSARWVEVLEPGEGYSGGETFFGPARDRRPGIAPPQRPAQHAHIVRIIPAGEIPSAANQLVTAPLTLQFALRLFMVGVAAGYALGEALGGNRSMLVHPSVRTADHQTYLHWIEDLFAHWRVIFRGNDAASDALAETFRPAYDDLALSVGAAMPAFDAVKARFRQAFHETGTKEVNRRHGGPAVIIDWEQHYGWILIGGAAMDRGFTVEGLTVTYMPRGMGGGNADTMQQRARFFGYKAGYLGYCRVYLERGSKQGFEDYVAHEEFMRNDLIAIRDSPDGLQDWPRRFILDESLKPCRDTVLSDGYARSVANDEGWVTPQAFMDDNGPETLNRDTVDRFVDSHEFAEDVGHAGRSPDQRHMVTAALPLREVLDTLLARYRVRNPVEAETWTKMGALLGRLLDEDAGAQAVVYRMGGGRPRIRGMSPARRVKQLFQGAYPVHPAAERGDIYPGDRQVSSDTMVTVQIHELDLRYGRGSIVASHVPFLAVRLPTASGLLPLVTQVQDAQAALEDQTD